VSNLPTKVPATVESAARQGHLTAQNLLRSPLLLLVIIRRPPGPDRPAPHAACSRCLKRLIHLTIVSSDVAPTLCACTSKRANQFRTPFVAHWCKLVPGWRRDSCDSCDQTGQATRTSATMHRLCSDGLGRACRAVNSRSTRPTSTVDTVRAHWMPLRRDSPRPQGISQVSRHKPGEGPMMRKVRAS
jgi:hypothetical protein